MPGAAGGAQDPVKQAKESMKELKQMVETDEAKKMGYGEYNVLKKLRTTLRKRDSKAGRVYKDLREVMRNQEGEHGDDRGDDRGRDRGRSRDRSRSRSRSRDRDGSRGRGGKKSRRWRADEALAEGDKPTV